MTDKEPVRFKAKKEMNLTKQKLLEMIEQELEEGMLATAALTGLMSLSPAFVKAFKVRSKDQARSNIVYTAPEGRRLQTP